MKCKVCNEEDPTQFYKSNKSKCKRCCIAHTTQRQSGLLPACNIPRPHLCKDCGETNSDLFYPKNKGRCKQCASTLSTQRYHSLSADDKEAYKHRSSTWQDDNILLYRWRSARIRSVKKTREFTITIQDIEQLWEKQQGLCYYTNQSMKLARDDNRYSVSIDRLDTNIGYVPGNVVLCCATVNIMKNDLSLTEFTELVDLLHSSLHTLTLVHRSR